ncbi:unnamed protein product [Pleuronectes platessa]|uniref:Uncharacterized protein n=1 Tax=Pleuronectes platessa TaxID=8262 RepID=A0A9N7UX91_PLEPL|nr:unnamed protein product [Pleuronectes platessa]
MFSLSSSLQGALVGSGADHETSITAGGHQLSAQKRLVVAVAVTWAGASPVCRGGAGNFSLPGGGHTGSTSHGLGADRGRANQKSSSDPLNLISLFTKLQLLFLALSAAGSESLMLPVSAQILCDITSTSYQDSNEEHDACRRN